MYLLLAFLFFGANADVYMQSPRGANGRNCERNVNRNNANRLYDTQNNAKGGYACGRAVGGPEVEERSVYYYEGEKVPITWTSQHGSGAGTSVDGQIIFQWASTDTLDPTEKFSAAGNVGTPRNGIPRDANDAATDRIPNNAASAAATDVETRRFGMHESFSYYDRYAHTEREKGLFTADQNLNRNDARGTRQNPNGNRNGLEIPEERDYYPWSNPSPWTDIAVLDMKWTPEKDTYFQQNSHVLAKGLCVHPNMQQQQKYQQRDWPNNKRDCDAVNGATWQATLYSEEYDQTKGPVGPAPLVATLAASSANHLGTGEGYNMAAAKMAAGTASAAAGARELCLATEQTQLASAAKCKGQISSAGCTQFPTECAWEGGVCRAAVQYLAPQKGRGKCPTGSVATGTFYDDQRRYFDDNAGNTATGSTFYWSIPFGTVSRAPKAENTVLRMRYNISTHDFPAYTAGDNYLSNKKFNAAPGVNASFNCRGDNNNNGQACSTVSPITQDPYIQVRNLNTKGEGASILSLALNTNQFARTFQDRTHIFAIKKRPAPLDATGQKIIVGLTVKGKRGNIVQTFPAVEYDFYPKHLVVDEGAQVHIQWTGSDYNPQRGCNNGEGGPPDCNGCTNLATAIQAAAANSRADRTNLVPMGNNGQNFPAGAKGVDVDLYQTASLMGAQNANNMHPFASAWGVDFARTTKNGVQVKTQNAADDVLWNLMYINQEAELKEQFGAAATCLSQTELENINNKNRRENTPQNCAKLNGKAHPYFDAGVVSIKAQSGATAQTGKTYSFFSSRNNNFSNRDQTMDICVLSAADTNKEGCQHKRTASGQPDAYYNPFDASSSQTPIDGIIQQPGQIVPAPDPIQEETTAPIEKDNDGVGDGDADACEARMKDFVSTIGLAGMIAILVAVLVAGIAGTLLVQAICSRSSGSKKKKSWTKQIDEKPKGTDSGSVGVKL